MVATVTMVLLPFLALPIPAAIPVTLAVPPGSHNYRSRRRRDDHRAWHPNIDADIDIARVRKTRQAEADGRTSQCRE
jgi:hypothetical protein